MPDKVLTKPLHSEKVTAWVAMRRAGGPIGPFFFEDKRGGGSDNQRGAVPEIETTCADRNMEWECQCHASFVLPFDFDYDI